jgi:hypothetical protein
VNPFRVQIPLASPLQDIDFARVMDWSQRDTNRTRDRVFERISDYSRKTVAIDYPLF